MTNTNYQELLVNIKKRTHYSMPQCYRIMEQAYEKHTNLYMLWKVEDKSYSNWYERNKEHLNTTLEEETLYLVDPNNKAFGDFGGYSIFSTSLGTIKRRQQYGAIDRIERLPIEYGIVLSDEEYNSLWNYQ